MPAVPDSDAQISQKARKKARKKAGRPRGRRAAKETSGSLLGRVRTSADKRAMRRSAVKAATQEPKPPRRSPARWSADKIRQIRAALRKEGQLGLLLLAAHPVQALVLGAVVGGLALLSDRTFGQAVMSGLAVLIVQLALGLHNDVSDVALDRKAGRTTKPIAAGELPSGNATYVAIVLLVLAIPVALQSGTVAGVALLATLPIGYVHNRILHRTFASFLGWMATFALFPVFLAYGGWGGGRHGDDPTWQFIVAFAFVGLCAHLATSLPDLVVDNAAGVKSLPLRIALKTGAPRLLVITVVLSVLVLAAVIVVGIDPGLRQW